MTHEELKKFEASVATPKLQELLRNAKHPDFLRCIETLRIEVLDSRSVGTDYHVVAQGYTCNNGKVYAGTLCDIWFESNDMHSEMQWLQNAVFLTDGTVIVKDQLRESTLETKPYLRGIFQSVFPALSMIENVLLLSNYQEILSHVAIREEDAESNAPSEEEAEVYPEAIIVERDYKGVYERFALTPEEFRAEFPDTVAKGKWPITEADSDTLKPLVHIWFKPCRVNDDTWEKFFTDMEDELPESDIENGNLATIRLDLFKSLKLEISPYTYVRANAHTGNSEAMLLREWADAMS